MGCSASLMKKGARDVISYSAYSQVRQRPPSTAQEKPAPVRKHAGGRPRVYTDERLIELWHKGLLQKDIADTLGISRGSLPKILRRLGLPGRHKSRRPCDAE